MNQDAEAKLLKTIETPLRLTWVGLWAERVTRAFWPLWTVAIAAVAALALGLQDYAPLEISWFAMVITALATLALFVWPDPFYDLMTLVVAR